MLWREFSLDFHFTVKYLGKDGSPIQSLRDFFLAVLKNKISAHIQIN